MHDENDKAVRSVASWQENMTDFIVLSVLFGPENHLQPSTSRMPLNEPCGSYGKWERMN